MLSFVKLLKVALPVATTTVATIATTFLVSFGKQDPKHIEENIDKGLDDFQKPSENFEDKKMYYSTKGKAEGLTKLNDEQAEKLAQQLEEKGDGTEPIDLDAIPEETLEGKVNSPINSSLPNQENDPVQKQELNPSTSKDDSESIPAIKGLKDSMQDASLDGEDKSVNVAKSEDGFFDDRKVESQEGGDNKVDTDEEGGVQNSGSEENGSQEHDQTSDDNNGILANKKTEEGSEGSKQQLNENGEKSEEDKSKEGVSVSGPRDDKDQERGGSLDSGHGTDEVNSSPHIPSEEELKTLLGLEEELALVKSGLEGMLDN